MIVLLLVLLTLTKQAFVDRCDMLQVASSSLANFDNLVACNMCHVKFNRNHPSWSQKYKRHMIAHSGSKPFKCSLCNYKSSRKDSVKRHAKLRHFEHLQNYGGPNNLSNAIIQIVPEVFSPPVNGQMVVKTMDTGIHWRRNFHSTGKGALYSFIFHLCSLKQCWCGSDVRMAHKLAATEA